MRLKAALRADRGAAVEGGGPLGGDEQLGAVAADGLADPQLDDRHLVHRVAAEDEDRAGVVDLAGADREIGRGEAGAGGSAQAAAVAAGHVGGGERAADHALDQPALLVGGGAADDRGDLAAGRREAQFSLGRERRPRWPASARRRPGPAGTAAGPRSRTSGSRSGPCRRASRRRLPRCRGRARGRPSRRGP